jgi:[NiFe] hydrogenase large subunit
MSRVVVDPVTRIEGHQRIEVEISAGKVVDAWSSATLFRGMEQVLRGRKPADAYYIAQRICGVCPVSHGHASSMATEAALQVTIPNNARLVRNIIECAQYLHSHILWFYQLNALDYVDVVSALDADIADTYALAEEAGTTTADFGAIQARLKSFVSGAQLSIFSGNWFGSPAYKLSPELNLVATAHYLEAIEMQAVAAQVIALMGGKFPHFMTSLPGGTAWVPTAEKLGDILFRLKRVQAFVTDTMLPDLMAIAAVYKNDMATVGVGTKNLLSWGVFEDSSRDPLKRFLPRGAIIGGDLGAAVQPRPDQVIEYVDRAWYQAQDGSANPSVGKTDPEFTSYDVSGRYSWSKAPRLDGRPMEAGPLARLIVAYVAGKEPVRALVDDTLKGLGVPGRVDLLFSLLGRVGARTLEAKLLADQVLVYVDELVASIRSGDAALFASSTLQDGAAAGLWEAPRGALGHWIDIKDGDIANYQAVTPSTWNCGPRDQDGQRGPLEEALVGAVVADLGRPVEVMRIVHSFDP